MENRNARVDHIINIFVAIEIFRLWILEGDVFHTITHMLEKVTHSISHVEIAHITTGWTDYYHIVLIVLFLSFVVHRHRRNRHHRHHRHHSLKSRVIDTISRDRGA